jgi:hypothetical protein
MKKSLNTVSIVSELRGQSAFFPHHEEQAAPTKQITPARSPLEGDPVEEVSHPVASNDTVIPRHHDTMQPSNHGTMIPEQSEEEETIETVRKALKHIGKEAATHRFTLEEKQLLADIEYTYRRQGIRTSENEITRIAINYFAEDYKRNGENSMLAKVLKKLNS